MPFDEKRDGFVMGEGAAVFILERFDLAVKRGATILGEILGAASNADAYHITAPSPGGTGAITCMKLALEDAGLAPNQIKQVNATTAIAFGGDGHITRFVNTEIRFSPAIDTIK